MIYNICIIILIRYTAYTFTLTNTPAPQCRGTSGTNFKTLVTLKAEDAYCATVRVSCCCNFLLGKKALLCFDFKTFLSALLQLKFKL